MADAAIFFADASESPTRQQEDRRKIPARERGKPG
jgi:hypothetical protein